MSFDSKCYQSIYIYGARISNFSCFEEPSNIFNKIELLIHTASIYVTPMY